MKSALVLTHRRPDDVRLALETLVREARAAGVQLRFDPEETAKHGLTAGEGLVLDAEPSPDGVDLCVVLGGDGTILRALRLVAGTSVPVFAANFGQVGFLATVEADECEAGFRRALAGDFDLLHLPSIAIDGAAGAHGAVNDVSINRRVGERVAVLSYRLQGEEVGSVRADGLVVATPAGSTGYNLANGGPVLAWGVQGYVVSFVAPHSLTARALVVAPDDVVTVCNESQDEPVDVSVDGRPAGSLDPGESLECRFVEDVAHLAQVPGSTFYRRLREKFGHLV